MNICVIGCTGYLGSKISLDLSILGYKVIGICRKFPKGNLKFKRTFHKIIEGDIKDINTINKIEKEKFSILIFTVSLNHKDSEKNKKEAIMNNYLPLLKLATVLIKKEKPLKFIYISTMQVYGRYEESFRVVFEKDETHLINNYALTHALCEDTLRLLNSKLFQSTSVRLSNSYGYPQIRTCNCWWLVLNDFCKSAMLHRIISIKSDGSPQRDFMHIDDVSESIGNLVEYKAKLPFEINFASGQTHNILELALLVKQACKEHFNKNVEIIIKGKKISNSNLNRKIKKLSKVKKFIISNSNLKKLKSTNFISPKKGIYLTLKKIKEMS